MSHGVEDPQPDEEQGRIFDLSVMTWPFPRIIDLVASSGKKVSGGRETSEGVEMEV